MFTFLKNKDFNSFTPENIVENDFILPTAKMQFTEFTDWVINETKADQYYYLNQNPIESSFPELFPDIEIPEYINRNLKANSW
ncbi:hypothetical protein AB0758_48365 [Tolypothrix bouteillei VB521301_2]|uniref:hypothetical protein n=1 Tax=Tolypothrix bouteillei TaxID=1246981 RepID=UPI0038B4E0AF